jgi:NTE family protein
MSRPPPLWRAAAAIGLLGLAACVAPVDTAPLARIDQHSGYRYVTLEASAPKRMTDTGLIVTLSGGGTRAAALADGVLRALAETKIPVTGGDVALADEIDLVSSVSGGSVAAAYFALNGAAGMDAFENDFLKSDINLALVGHAAVNPTETLGARIQVLSGLFEDRLFGAKTYADLIAADKPSSRHPYTVLNATDMTTGSRFSFTQDQFDLLCSDLAEVKLADAVAASAAFPPLFTAQTIANHAPCATQDEAAARPGSGWEATSEGPAPQSLVNDLAGAKVNGVIYPSEENLGRFRLGTVERSYLNRYGQQQYIQLLDGGLADNLGLGLPLQLLGSDDTSPAFLGWIRTKKITRLLLVVVDARSQQSTHYAEEARPPGIVDMILTSIGTPIDAVSFQLLSQIDTITEGQLDQKARAVALVDFDLIADYECRRYFHNIATSWTLSKTEIDNLIALGRAMLLQSPQYRDMVKQLGGTAPTADPTVDQICQKALATH